MAFKERFKDKTSIVGKDGEGAHLVKDGQHPQHHSAPPSKGPMKPISNSPQKMPAPMGMGVQQPPMGMGVQQPGGQPMMMPGPQQPMGMMNMGAPPQQEPATLSPGKGKGKKGVKGMPSSQGQQQPMMGMQMPGPMGMQPMPGMQPLGMSPGKKGGGKQHPTGEMPPPPGVQWENQIQHYDYSAALGQGEEDQDEKKRKPSPEKNPILKYANQPLPKWTRKSSADDRERERREQIKAERAQHPSDEDPSYVPYTMKDWKMMKEKPIKLGGLGPSDSDEQRFYRHMRNKMQDYAQSCNRVNITLLAAAQADDALHTKPIGPQPSKHTKERSELRSKAMEFAKNVPKPKVKPKDTESELEGGVVFHKKVHKTGERSPSPGDHEEEEGMKDNASEQLLMELEAKHAKDQEMIMNMKRQLKLI